MTQSIDDIGSTCCKCPGPLRSEFSPFRTDAVEFRPRSRREASAETLSSAGHRLSSDQVPVSPALLVQECNLRCYALSRMRIVQFAVKICKARLHENFLGSADSINGKTTLKAVSCFVETALAFECPASETNLVPNHIHAFFVQHKSCHFRASSCARLKSNRYA